MLSSWKALSIEGRSAAHPGPAGVSARPGPSATPEIACGRTLRLLVLRLPRHRSSSSSSSKLGTGGVEGQQIDLQVEQVRDLAVDLLIHRLPERCSQSIPITRVIGRLGRPVDPRLGTAHQYAAASLEQRSGVRPP